MDKFFEHAAEILAAAAKSTLGIVGLMVLALAVLAFLFFYAERTGVKVGIFLLLFFGASLYTYSVVLESRPESTPPVGKSQQAPSPSAPATPAPQATRERVDCGEHWTGWVNIGGAVGNPCPSGCERGREVGQAYRSVGLLPPRPQTKHKFQCWRTETAK